MNLTHIVAQNLSAIMDVICEPNIETLNRVLHEQALQRINELLRLRDSPKVKDAVFFTDGEVPYLAIQIESELYLLCKGSNQKESLSIYRAHESVFGDNDEFLKFGVLWSVEKNVRTLYDIITHLAKHYKP